jgi:hypothetical protein
VQLTEYELTQVREIAEWKSRPPNPFAEIFRLLTSPGVKLAENAVPDAVARRAINLAFEAAQKLVGNDEEWRRVGSDNLSDLRRKPLEECDRLALRIGTFSQIFATAEGCATGAGGIFTTLIDVPLLFVISLWTVIKIGHCYGYPLNQRRDRHFVLATLIAAISGIVETRSKRIDELHEIEEMLVEETQEEIVTEELLSILFQLELFEGIPGIGAISGGGLNLAYIRRVDLTARRVFQERWLKDNGKVRSIARAPVHERDLVGGWAGALRRAAYSGSYAGAFTVALPACLLSSLFPGVQNALTRGASRQRENCENPDRTLDRPDQT